MVYVAGLLAHDFVLILTAILPVIGPQPSWPLALPHELDPVARYLHPMVAQLPATVAGSGSSDSRFTW
jgi:hypothetical protein